MHKVCIIALSLHSIDYSDHSLYLTSFIHFRNSWSFQYRNKNCIVKKKLLCLHQWSKSKSIYLFDVVFIVIMNKQLYSIELHLMEGRYTCPECICKYFKLDRSKCFHLSALRRFSEVKSVRNRSYCNIWAKRAVKSMQTKTINWWYWSL